MAESLAFDLKLVDSVTANAKRAADSLRLVQDQAKKTQSALDFGKERHRAEFNLQKLGADPKGYVALIKAQKELKEKRDKLLEDAGIKKPESFFGALTSRFSFAKMASAAAVGELVGEGVMKVAETLVEGAKMAVEVLTDGIKESFRAAGKEQTSRIYETNALGGAGGRAFREDAERFAKLTPFDDAEIRRMMLPLRKAGLSQSATRQAFATATDIGGGDAGQVQGILEQFQRIYTKRGIGKKQLVELLGNVGTTIPDFYKALGAKMHISAKAAEKKAEEGGLDPQLIMNMITEAQNKRQGGVAGTGGKRFADSFEARWKKITQLPEEFYKKFVDSPSFTRANETIGKFLEQISPDSPAGQRIMASLDRMFDRIGGLLQNPDELVDGLVDGIENAIGLFEQLLPSIKTLGYGLSAAAQDMAELVTSARIYAAVVSGDKAEATRIFAEQRDAKIQRMVSRFQDENGRKAKQEAQGTAFGKFATGDIYGAFSAAAPRPASAGGKHVTVKVEAGAVQVQHNGSGDDATHTGQKVGQEIHKHVVNAVERAAAEGGG